MIKKTLGPVFRFFAEARQARAERFRDFSRESSALDKFGDQELVDGMDREIFVRPHDVAYILKRIQAREAFRLSEDDRACYVQPVLGKLQHDIKCGEIECRIALDERLPDGVRVRTGDFLDLLGQFDLPAGGMDAPRATEMKTVHVNHFSKGALGRLQEKMEEAAPLRTPSTDIRYERQQAEHHLNIWRPFIMAIGLAGKFRAQNAAIEAGAIPTYKETLPERKIREQKENEARYYRGQRMK